MKIKILLFITLLAAGLTAGEQWEHMAPMGTARAGAATVVWDGKIYVFGGKSLNNKILSSVEVYDPDLNSWDSISVPSFDKARYNSRAVVWKNQIYLIGGRNADKALKECEIYDPVQKEWDKAQNLREEREGHAVAILNKKIYTIGGQSGPIEYVEEIEWYDAGKDSWEEADSEIPYPRVAPFHAVVDSVFYMLGGYYYGINAMVYAFKPTPYDDTDTEWTLTDTLTVPRYYGATAVVDSIIYLMGGETVSGKTNLVESYDLYNHRFTQEEAMPAAYSGMTAVTLNGKIYVIGGYNSNGQPVNEVYRFTPRPLALQQPAPPAPRHYQLTRAWPTPFNGRLNIAVDLELRANVKIDIFNITGARVATLSKMNALPGRHLFYWNALGTSGRPLPSGPYFLRTQAGSKQHMIKVLYVK